MKKNKFFKHESEFSLASLIQNVLLFNVNFHDLQLTLVVEQ